MYCDLELINSFFQVLPFIFMFWGLYFFYCFEIYLKTLTFLRFFGFEFVGFGWDEGRGIAIVHGKVATLGHRPDPLVAVGGHDVQNFQLALQDDIVGLPLGVPFEGPGAVDVVTIQSAVAVEPVEVLVQHGKP